MQDSVNSNCQTILNMYSLLAALLAVIDAQNKLSQAVLDRCEGKKQFKELISTIMDYPKRSLPWKEGSEVLSLLFTCCDLELMMVKAQLLQLLLTKRLSVACMPA
jgi:hypothetical protein